MNLSLLPLTCVAHLSSIQSTSSWSIHPLLVRVQDEGGWVGLGLLGGNIVGGGSNLYTKGGNLSTSSQASNS
jgi:hypothetical protein